MSESKEDQSHDTHEAAEARNEERRQRLIREGKLIPARKPESLSAAPPPLARSGRDLTANLDEVRNDRDK